MVEAAIQTQNEQFVLLLKVPAQEVRITELAQGETQIPAIHLLYAEREARVMRAMIRSMRPLPQVHIWDTGSAMIAFTVFKSSDPGKLVAHEYAKRKLEEGEKMHREYTGVATGWGKEVSREVAREFMLRVNTYRRGAVIVAQESESHHSTPPLYEVFNFDHCIGTKPPLYEELIPTAYLERVYAEKH